MLLRTLTIAFAGLVAVTASVVAEPKRQDFGYDVATGSVCAFDRATPPQCVPIGRIDSANHVVTIAGGIDAAAAKCDGTTDDRVAIEAAAAALASKGGVVRLPAGRTCYVSGLTVPASVTIDGGHPLPDSPAAATTPSFGTVGGIALASSGTITLGVDAAIQNVLVKRAGMTFPASDASAFAGTAITMAGDGAAVRGVSTLGFAVCIAETGTSLSRWIIDGLHCDGVDGVLITVPSWDTSVLRNAHIWPFSTVSNPPAGLVRTGTGIKISGGGQDDTQIHNSLVFGYAVDLDLSGANGNISVDNVWLDGTGGSGTICLQTGGNLDRTHVGNISLNGCYTNAYFNHGAGRLFIDHVFSSGASTTGAGGIVVAGGSTSIGSLHHVGSAGWPVVVSSTSAELEITRGRIEASNGSTSNPYIAIPAGGDTDHIRLGAISTDQVAGASLTGSNALVIPAIASASTIAPPVVGSIYRITGSTAISTITGTWGGRRLTLKFDGDAAVVTGGNVALGGGARFQGAAGAVLDLLYDQTVGTWVEVGRSGDAYTAYTPTVSAASGSFTTVSASGRYIQRGKTVSGSVTVTITSAGTASGGLGFTLPVVAKSGIWQIAVGRRDGVGGNIVQASVSGNAPMMAYDASNGSLITNGAAITVSFTYEAN